MIEHGRPEPAAVEASRIGDPETGGATAAGGAIGAETEAGDCWTDRGDSVAGADGGTEPGPDAPADGTLIDHAVLRHGEVGVDLLEDRDVVLQTISAGIQDARREVCSMLPAGPYRLDVLKSSWEQDTELLAAGIAAPVIYQADAARHPAVLAFLGELAAAGAQVRVARRVTHRVIIVDRRLVFVATKADTLRPPYLQIREPALVRNFCAQFAATWAASHSVGVGPEDSLDTASVREILAVLSSGVTDEVAARQLGVSPRTIRRRVAAVLILLGANSRFEAGVKAAQTGWL